MNTLFVFKIYLVYGLAFITLFFSILFRDTSKSTIRIARVLPYLGAAGLILGFHEWSELYLVIYQQESIITDPLKLLLIGKLLIALLPLSLFAWKMLDIIDFPYARAIRQGWGIIVVIYTVNFVYQYTSHDPVAYYEDLLHFTRIVFGFVASAIAGCALIQYSRVMVQKQIPKHVYFFLSGIAFFIYGIGSGLMSEHVGHWVLIFRCVGAVTLLAALWQALKVFDIERKQQIEEALSLSLQNQKLKELGELSSAVAHEIKTPISSALMSCDLLEQSLHDGEATKRNVSRIRRGLERAAHISQEVLRYSHQRPIAHEKIAVEELILSAIDLLQYRLTSYELNLDTSKNIFVSGDKALLEEALVNLISNAIDASSQNKRLAVYAIQHKDKVIIKVRDWGTGMTPATLSKATQPFFTTKPIGQGTGMGLALVKQAATQHNGSIQFSNACPGLLVEFTLPGAQR